MKKLVPLLLLGSLLIGCGAPSSVATAPAVPTILTTDTSTPKPPTQTPLPTATATATIPPTPDPGTIGLPGEPAGTVAFDFVEQMCAAEWYTEGQSLPCPGDTNQDTGYVMRFEDEVENVPPGFPMMLTYPPLVHYSKIFSKYPEFTVREGDRFRAVVACRKYALCDVDFYLNFFNEGGERYLNRWRYLFTYEPVVIDYPLDSLAGETVRFDLAVVSKVNHPDRGYAVWIAPHIYRPNPE